MSSHPTVYIIDDDKAVRDSLAWLVEATGLAVKTYEAARGFLRDVAAEGVAEGSGCIIVDVRLPEMNGLDLQDALLERNVHLPVIVITGHGEVPVAVRALKAGAFDFIEKPFSEKLLLDRIRDAIHESTRHQRLAQGREAILARLQRLSPRERQVMELVVQGKLNKQIAAELGLSPKTVEVHRAHVMNKMEADSLAELVRLAIELERVDA